MKPLLSPELNHRHATTDRLFAGVTAPLDLADDDRLRDAVIRRLRTKRLFSRLSDERLAQLARQLRLQPASEDETLVSADHPLESFLILISGSLSIQGQSSNGELHYSQRLLPTDRQGVIAPTARHELKTSIKALTRAHYLLLDQQLLDEYFGWPAGSPDIPPVSLLDLLDIDTLEEVHKRMRRQDVVQGQRLVSQGDPARHFYLLLAGTAEVTRLSSVDGQSRILANLAAGDSFGEEGLLQSTTRNATVRMTSDGEIGTLDKSDFDSLIRPVLAPEIEIRAAQEQVDSGYAQWLDVRFEPEFNSGCMPDARLIPLDQIRSRAHELDPDMVYIVYCNNGHRSLAATFLLRERNIDACHLTGGISDFRQAASERA
jgi:CRP-like cAMP-binding protein